MKIFPEFQKKVLLFLIWWMILPPIALFFAVVVSDYQHRNMRQPKKHVPEAQLPETPERTIIEIGDH